MFMNRRDGHVGIVAKQRNDLFWLGVGDPRETSQIAEPNDGVDALRNTPHDSSTEHAFASVAAKIGFHQRSRHARERYRFDGKREVRDDTFKRAHLAVVEP